MVSFGHFKDLGLHRPLVLLFAAMYRKHGEELSGFADVARGDMVSKGCNVLTRRFMVLQEDDYAVSPSSPLVSTALDDNGWVCGEHSDQHPPALILCGEALHEASRTLPSLLMQSGCLCKATSGTSICRRSLLSS